MLFLKTFYWYLIISKFNSQKCAFYFKFEKQISTKMIPKNMTNWMWKIPWGLNSSKKSTGSWVKLNVGKLMLLTEVHLSLVVQDQMDSPENMYTNNTIQTQQFPFRNADILTEWQLMKIEAILEWMRWGVYGRV